MNKEHRFYPGSGHPEVNSPTSCFACITSLSGVVTVWWKKVQRELDSILLSSDVLVSTSPVQGALPTPFIEGAKLAAEASRFARGSSGNLADSPLVKGDAPRSARPACSGRGGVARRLSCPSSHLSLLRAGEVRHGMCHVGLPREPSNSQR